ncbi:MFS transporter [Solimonas terrae]|uniref:MFS transporter n=1 Tax=Solimonas terrae TaxID=1396819 RepID=A0A6M2BQK7_9GAMM|nr:MFS transporter [Solimonas terrae]NGY04359.1 MFS transporter [Solimonas terrae]
MNTTVRVAAPARRGVILATCCLSLLVVSMDASIVNVALPAIRDDLNASLSGLQWVIDAYTIVLASFLMLGGATADRFGRRRVFQFGMVLFVAGSLLCSLAGSVTSLVAARVVQALGGSMLNPVAMSIVVNTFTEPKARARAIGIWGAVAGISMALGPLAGGALTQGLGWHAIFWINVPIGALALFLTARYVPESRAPQPRRPDPIGQLLLLVGLGALVFSLIEGPRLGGALVFTVLLALAAFVALLVYEPRRPEPLLDLRFFHSLPFSSATLIAVCMFAAMGAYLFLGSIYLQEVRGLSAFHAGLCILPMALAIMALSPLSGRLVAAHGARPSLLISGTMLCISALLMTDLGVDTPLSSLLLNFCLFGIGFGMVNAPVTYAAVSGMPRAQAGLASAIASTSRQIGISLGVAIAGALVGGHGASTSWAAYPAATHPMWWLLLGAGVLILGLGLLSTGARGRASVERIAHLLQEPRTAS